MRHLKKKYATPIRPWDRQRIDAERELLAAFGLRNKRELWRTEAELRKFRRLAREFAASRNEAQEKIIIEKLARMGILGENEGLDDILSLNVRDFLERRLQTVLERKGLANSVRHARQMITHGHVKIGGRKVVYPSYMVSRDDEQKITAVQPKTKAVKSKAEEKKPEEAEKGAEKKEAG